MAAAKSKGAKGIASLGKRAIFGQIWTASSTRSSTVASLSLRPVSIFYTRWYTDEMPPLELTPVLTTGRAAQHTSAYDKNIDDQVHPSIVPDDVIQPQSEEYWSPHPQTGVFGPATDHKPVAGSGEQFLSSPTNFGEDGSELEEKAWFRPTSLQDVEKPHHN
uniref:Uncharacterized protein MANES_08G164900 n=1 Tax=Rhizophora mucronata TaxID=61149 RepID=A0A2P2KAA4_RHIMU